MAGQPYILIVDDESAFREIFSAKLGAEGFRVDAAENGMKGVEKAKQTNPDLILMDVNMPIMDGAAAVLALQEDPATKNIKVAFLTSLGDPRLEMQEQNKKFAEQFGVKDYLKKTDDLDVLVARIKRLLQ